MRYWWVNQNKTYRHEIDGGYLWAPKSGKWHHEILTQLSPGDLVFSFKGTQITAVGVVQKSAETMPKPDFGSEGENWSDIGWCVYTEFTELDEPFKPSLYMEQIRPMLPEKYAPLQSANGKGVQIYLTELPPLLGDFLLQLSKEDVVVLQNELAPVTEEEVDESIQYEILAKGLQGNLEKIQITKARRGQGIFRANVRLLEHSCRVTGVTNPKHLRASHIKPWRMSNDQEKLDGNNGLMLSPHVDHLFDQGFISFKNSGELIIAKKLNPIVLEQWSISTNQNVGQFNDKQTTFLEFHRDVVFKAS